MFKHPRERRLLAITLCLLLLLVGKSLVFDPLLGALTPEKQVFKEAIEQLIDDEYRSKGLAAIGVVQFRLIDIKPITEKELTEAKANDLVLIHPYVAKTRKYLLWVIPIGDVFLMK